MTKQNNFLAKIKAHSIYIVIQFICFLLLWYPFVLDIKNMIPSGGDGTKNLFAFSDYILHGKGLKVFGMNYPYGENVIFTDGELPLAAILRWIHLNIIPLNEYIFYIHNAWLLFQILFGIICFYFLIHKILGNKIIATCCAIVLVFLSPQLDRLGAHFSLSYVFVYALFFYLLLKNNEGTFKYKNAFALCLLVIFAGLSHLYYIYILYLFYGIWFLLLWLRRKTNLKKQLLFQFALIVAFITVFIISQAFDTNQYRTHYSKGFMSYNGAFEGTFYPFMGPENDWFRKTFHHKYEVNNEAYNFLGFVAILLNFFGIIFFIFKKEFREKLPSFILGIWTSGFLLWLYSLGKLYTFLEPDISSKIPIIPHFRSIGRCGIVWYYAVGIFASYMLYYLWRLKNNMVKSLVVFLFIAWFFEGILFQKSFQIGENKKFSFDNDIFYKRKYNIDSILKINHLSLNDIQATLVVPVSQGGNMLNSFAEGYFTAYFGLNLAYHYNIPTIGSMYTRADEMQAQNILQLLSRRIKDKNLPKKFNSKAILLIYDANYDKMGDNELALIHTGKFLGNIEDMYLSIIYKNDFNKIYQPQKELKNALAATIYGKAIKEAKDRFVLAEWKGEDLQNLIARSDSIRIQYECYTGPDIRFNRYYTFLKDKNHNDWQRFEFNYTCLYDLNHFYQYQQNNFSAKQLKNVESILLYSDYSDGKIKNAFIGTIGDSL